MRVGWVRQRPAALYALPGHHAPHARAPIARARLQVTIASGKDLTARLVSIGAGWLCTALNVDGHEYAVRYVDLGAVIKKLYGKGCPGFAYEYDPSQPSEPQGGTVWRREQEGARARLGSRAHIAAVQVYGDATQVTTFSNLSVHPLYASLSNLPYPHKVKAIETIAYMPRPERGDMTDAEFRLHKLRLLHAVYDLVLQPLKAMAKKVSPAHRHGTQHCVSRHASAAGTDVIARRRCGPRRVQQARQMLKRRATMRHSMQVAPCRRACSGKAAMASGAWWPPRCSALWATTRSSLRWPASTAATRPGASASAATG